MATRCRKSAKRKIKWIKSWIRSGFFLVCFSLPSCLFYFIHFDGKLLPVRCGWSQSCTTSKRLFVLLFLLDIFTFATVQYVSIFSFSFPINRKTDFWICAHKSTDAFSPTIRFAFFGISSAPNENVKLVKHLDFGVDSRRTIRSLLPCISLSLSGSFILDCWSHAYWATCDRCLQCGRYLCVRVSCRVLRVCARDCACAACKKRARARERGQRKLLQPQSVSINHID